MRQSGKSDGALIPSPGLNKESQNLNKTLLLQWSLLSLFLLLNVKLEPKGITKNKLWTVFFPRVCDIVRRSEIDQAGCMNLV